MLKPGDPIRVDSDLTGVTAITPNPSAQPGDQSGVWECTEDGWRGRINDQVNTLLELLSSGATWRVLETEEAPVDRSSERVLRLVHLYGNAMDDRGATRVQGLGDKMRQNAKVAHALFAEIEAALSTPEQPEFLELPTVPDAAVALVGVESGRRWTRYLLTSSWQSPEGVRSLSYVLRMEGRVRVEYTEPEPTPLEAIKALRAAVNTEGLALLDIIEKGLA